MQQQVRRRASFYQVSLVCGGEEDSIPRLNKEGLVLNETQDKMVLS